MKLNEILRQYETALREKYADRLLPRLFRAIHAGLCCKTEEAGSFKLQCTECQKETIQPRSCGHRCVFNVNITKLHDGLIVTGKTIAC